MTAAVTAELPQWSQYADGSWPTILIGNGLGINLWVGFRYASLFEQADLPAEAQGIFTELGTTNFEAVLECLYHAGVAQTALHDDATRIDQAYGQVQHSLFTAVARSHVPWGTLSFWHHNVIAASLNKHSAVFTTNYDLCLYWSRLETTAPVKFVDFLWTADGVFDVTNVEVWDSAATAMYHLHGGLHLWQDNMTGDSGKWLSESGNLLDLQPKYAARTSRQPLFVSEGTSSAKLRTIQRSPYLSFCRERLVSNDGNTVVFGHALARQDQHIIDALNAGPGRRMAVSVFPTGNANEVIGEKARILNLLAKHEVVFFDSTTHPLGDPALHVS